MHQCSRVLMVGHSNNVKSDAKGVFLLATIHVCRSLQRLPLTGFNVLLGQNVTWAGAGFDFNKYMFIVIVHHQVYFRSSQS